MMKIGCISYRSCTERHPIGLYFRLVLLKVQRCVRLVSYIASGLVPDGLVCIIFNRSVLHHAISLHIFSQLVKEVLFSDEVHSIWSCRLCSCNSAIGPLVRQLLSL